MSEQTIYLDPQATTPVEPEVIDAMVPWLARPGNPHAQENTSGREASGAVERAREQVASLLGGDPQGITFTSGATEGANIVLRSFVPRGGSLVLSSIEHPCVHETAKDRASS